MTWLLGPQNPLPSRERLGSASVGGRLSFSSARKQVWASWSLSVPGNWLAHLTFPCTGSSSHNPQMTGALPDSLPRGRTDALLSRWANTSEGDPSAQGHSVGRMSCCLKLIGFTQIPFPFSACSSNPLAQTASPGVGTGETRTCV